MQIEEVFRLANGRTLFTGVISGHAGTPEFEQSANEKEERRDALRASQDPPWF
jgi:hypothetical protein